jgi:glycosyltransferase involved in cell wall biosynthesis
MSTTPLVSIIMNCYNSERFLKEAIESIYAQTYTNWEIIFWDNASNDSSSEIAKSFDSRLKYHSAKITKPLGEARNYALKKAKGKYIAFLDCDDLYLSDKLKKQVEISEINNSTLCYGSAIVINEAGEELNRHIVTNENGYIFDKLLRHYEINMQSTLVRLDFLQANNITFDEKLKYSPDFNLFMRVAALADVCVLQECLVKYRKTSDSLTARSCELIYSERKYTLDQLSKDEELLKINRSAFNFSYKMLNYFKAISHINKGEKKLARKCFREVINIKWKYKIFYFVLFLPLSNKFILKKIFR